ncbi:hypothetical protein IHQ71_05080 [Rhizobium sp. TH2]|uniref:hypothetical protein n=1 Tax=Rhizobium sp. TH2 TaxID=2775403 RepID=UPI00215880E0|nr:hypothetical protein [Rhizobium sp. TH2]UVC09986.1 hypothetical protein IHQ71_05080 [Rhizobium sp. TH2]
MEQTTDKSRQRLLIELRMPANCRRSFIDVSDIRIDNRPPGRKEAFMQDMLAALLLVDHFSGRYRPVDRPPARPEPESPWTRIFAWHRRNTSR